MCWLSMQHWSEYRFLLQYYLLSRRMSAKERFVTICTARHLEAHVIQGRLASEGIPAILSYESAGLVYGLTVDGLGEVKILVPNHLAKEAKEILGI